MKKLILIFALFTLFSCDNETAVIETPEENNTILGRWHLVGFEQTVMYDFKAEFRHTIYATNGTFGPTETNAIPNPNPWHIEDNKLIIDHFFDNISSNALNFKCSGNVVELLEDDGTINSTLFREGFDYATCN